MACKKKKKIQYQTLNSLLTILSHNKKKIKKVKNLFHFEQTSYDSQGPLIQRNLTEELIRQMGTKIKIISEFLGFSQTLDLYHISCLLKYSISSCLFTGIVSNFVPHSEEVFKLFFVKTPSTLLKITEDYKELLFIWVISTDIYHNRN